MYWPKSGLFQWRMQKDSMPYLLITSYTAHGWRDWEGLEVLYLFSQAHLNLSELPSNISNKNIPLPDTSSAQHLLLGAKAQLSAHHQFFKLFH